MADDRMDVEIWLGVRMTMAWAKKLSKSIKLSPTLDKHVSTYVCQDCYISAKTNILHCFE